MHIKWTISIHIISKNSKLFYLFWITMMLNFKKLSLLPCLAALGGHSKPPSRFFAQYSVYCSPVNLFFRNFLLVSIPSWFLRSVLCLLQPNQFISLKLSISFNFALPWAAVYNLQYSSALCLASFSRSFLPIIGTPNFNSSLIRWIVVS